MARITNADQILVLLQAHLERLERKKKPSSATPARAGKTTGAARTPLERVQALAATEALTEDELGRALIAALLSQEFGPELSSDVAFQQVVEQVTKAVLGDAEASALLRRAIAQLVSG